jgi:hypothetical protein
MRILIRSDDGSDTRGSAITLHAEGETVWTTLNINLWRTRAVDWNTADAARGMVG